MKRNIISLVLMLLLASSVVGCAANQTEQSNSVTQSGNAPTLTIDQPADGSIVNVSSVNVEGRTSPGATVSVNNSVVISNSAGDFSLNISLDEGPNIINVLASDEVGNEASDSITVTYIKEE